MPLDQHGPLIVNLLQSHKNELVEFLKELVLAESPSTDAESQGQVLRKLGQALSDFGFAVEYAAGTRTGGHLLARDGRQDLAGKQLILGHADTVWPVGTLEKMPFEVRDGMIKGPGVFDMKGGLVQMVFALQAISHLGLEPELNTIILINTDEEIGSFESGPHIRQLAQEVDRVFVLEPALGPKGKLKTSRKGVGDYTIEVKGRAAHAGLDPEKGISAILEMCRVIEDLQAMNDPVKGMSVSVGIIQGGTRINVIPPMCTVEVDVRAKTMQDAALLEESLKNLKAHTPGCEVVIQGEFNRLPMEATERNQALWETAVQLGSSIGIELEQGAAGGGSDGNITSQYTATLDGLGAVGDGAHADHEFLYSDKLLERSALLALLLLAPP